MPARKQLLIIPRKPVGKVKLVYVLETGEFLGRIIPAGNRFSVVRADGSAVGLEANLATFDQALDAVERV